MAIFNKLINKIRSLIAPGRLHLDDCIQLNECNGSIEKQQQEREARGTQAQSSPHSCGMTPVSLLQAQTKIFITKE